MTPLDLVKLYDVSSATAELAMEKLRNKTVVLLTVSGKIGAGKDTVAPRVVNELGYANARHESFAKPLREEVNKVIDCIKQASNLDGALDLVEKELACANHYEAVFALYEDVKVGKVNNSYERTDSTRRALQWWGTEVRRIEDEDYWVKRSMKTCVEALAQGISVYVTDSRFVNEVDAVLNIGGEVVRLAVSEATQIERIIARDGIPPKEESFVHESETALDDYIFPFVIDTDELTSDEVIKQTLIWLRKEMFALAV